jgi:hypothetical protein
MQRHDLAEECYDRALAIEGPRLEATRSELYILRGNARSALNRGPEAVADYSAGLDLDREAVSAYILRSQVLVLSGRFREARSDAEAAITLEPTSGEARRARATALAALIHDRREIPTGYRSPAANLRRNRDRVATAAAACGWKVDQTAAVLVALNDTESVVWLARCAGVKELVRLVALVVTSERLIWCRRAMLGHEPCATASYATIQSVSLEDDGFSVRLAEPVGAAGPPQPEPPRSDRRLGNLSARVRRLAFDDDVDPSAPRFGQVRGGFDLSELNITLEKGELGLLVEELVNHARAG